MPRCIENGCLVMSIDIELQRRLLNFQLDVKFSSSNGITALFGRSGAGKTCIVNMISGLLKPHGGHIVVDERCLYDAGRGIDLPQRKRRVGYIFQQGLLFPHFTVRQNLLYGHRFTAPAERYLGLDTVVELLGIGHLLKRRPASLSGGEQQRVAIGRALLASPKLLLMDEPLSSLDAERKNEILPYIERLRDDMGVPIFYVSHSIEEVARLANTVVVLTEGQVKAAGPVQEIMSRLDLHPFTGRFEAGAVLEAQVKRHEPQFDISILGFNDSELRLPLAELVVGAHVRVHIRARDVAIALEQPHDISILNILSANIVDIRYGDGAYAEVQLDVGRQLLVSRVTRKSVHDLGLTQGKRVYALIKSIAVDRSDIGLFHDQ